MDLISCLSDIQTSSLKLPAEEILAREEVIRLCVKMVERAGYEVIKFGED
jgi:hypothetical protein